ncbi:fibronectin type III domain-containing protein [Paenibacillus periandrae]|uniref:fibronectin type III domain-containing protein n=1 Tax=Paenibacillus periandrae TaxID=1761741 RepID=UPI001F0948A1|nr:fibronectin type III domain-containing protein [Paenibacillus periandrae]
MKKYLSGLLLVIFLFLLASSSSVSADPVQGNMLVGSTYGWIRTPDAPNSVSYSTSILGTKADVDGNETTTTNFDTAYYYYAKISSTSVTIKSIRFFASQAVTFTFYDGTNNTRLYTYSIAANDSTYHSINVPNVKIIGVHVESDAKVKEWYVSSADPIPSAPLALTAIPENAQVDLTWSTVTGTTGYNIKRSTTPSGPYITVANNVYGSPYTDTTVTNGITYYYVVTALNAGGESGNSNEASATPMGSSRVILTTTMTNGDIFEHNISKAELTTFLAWFDAKAAGTGPAKYTFTNQHLKGSFLARKNSLIFDKILKLNYDEYSISGSGAPTEVAEITAGTALSIILTDGKVEEFILSAADYNAFVAWYDAKSAGTGPARYTFENPLKKGPFLARHEVVIFDKISSYDSEDFN